MNPLLTTTTEALIDELGSKDPRTGISSILGDLIPLHAFYVTASASAGIRDGYQKEPELIAKAMFDDTDTINTGSFSVDVQNHRTKMFLRTLQKMDQLVACGLIAMTEQFYPGTAEIVAKACRHAYENAETIGA